MGLDVRLYSQKYDYDCKCSRCGHEHKATTNDLYFEDHITNNLILMASKSDLYQALWEPEQLEINLAEDLIPYLVAGLHKLVSDPQYYRCFEPKVTSGSYEQFVTFIREYLHACRMNPDAEVEIDV